MKIVQPNVPYSVSADNLQSSAITNAGIDYGLLVTPYKFHFSDQSLSGAATIGGYAGYHLAGEGAGVQAVLSGGLGVVPITKVENGTTNTSNAASLSLSGGFIINLMKSGMFQVGLLFGVDWAGNGSQYKYDGKPWFAFSFGTNFTK